VFLRKHPLALGEWCVFGGEELVEGHDGIVATREGLAALVPRERKAGTVALIVGIRSSLLEEAEARLPSESGRRHLVAEMLLQKLRPGSA